MNIKDKILIFINNLYKINERTNIFHELPKNKDFPLDNYVAEYIIFHEKELNSYLNYINSIEINDFAKKIAEYSTERTIKTVIELNQYVEVDTILVNKLYDLYEEFVVKTFKKLCLSDCIDLDWINRLVMEHQLKILNISIEEIKEPILDFGCGSNAKLVHYLRELGLEAYGVDRTTNNKLYTIQADWFKYELKPNYWGTIISHLSFTNHFKMSGNHIAYARKYMDLLGSLKLGGEFYYTPDLPFIEQFLPSNLYLINKNTVNNSYKFLENQEPLNIQSV